MSGLTVIGLDLSLTSTGIGGRDWCERFRPRVTGHERLRLIRGEVRRYEADLFVIEGPSFGSKGNALHQLGGLWWLIAQDLWERGQTYAVVAPHALKKYATGNGGAGKDEVLAGVVRRFPHIEVRGNDEADAVVLAAMGYDHCGDPVVQMPAAHRVALDKVEWPRLDRLAA